MAIVTTTGPRDALPEWVIGSDTLQFVRGSAPPHLGSIGEVEVLAGGELVVEDNQTDRIHLFDASGAYVRLLADRGDGPGEFQQVTELTVGPDDSLFVYDRRHDRLSVLHPEAGFVRSVSFPRRPPGFGTLDVFYVEPGLLLARRLGVAEGSGPQPRRDPRVVLLGVHGADGTLIRDLPPFDGGFGVDFSDGNASAPFSPQPVVEVSGREILHGTGLEYRIDVSHGDGSLVRSIRWVDRAVPLGQEEVDSLRRRSLRIFQDAPEEQQAILRSLADARHSETVTPELRPAMGQVLTDGTGRIWIAEFVPPGLDPPRDWDVVSVNGDPVATLRAPPGARVVAVRGDRVVLVVRDAFDVESILVRPLLTR